MGILPIIIRAKGKPSKMISSVFNKRWTSSSWNGPSHLGNFIAVMEVTPNSSNPSTLGTVIKHITVLHTLYKNSLMKDKAFSQFCLKKILLPYREKKVTNFIIRGLLAGPHRSPLIQCSCFIGNSPKIIIVRDSSTY